MLCVIEKGCIYTMPNIIFPNGIVKINNLLQWISSRFLFKSHFFKIIGYIISKKVVFLVFIFSLRNFYLES